MRAFIANYYESKHGPDYHTVVTAETQTAALGWLLQYFGDTQARYWELEEFDPANAGIHIY